MTPWTAAHRVSLSFLISQSLLKLMSIELVVVPSNHFSLCPHLLLLCLFFPSIRVFSNDSALHIRWPEYWSFSSGPSMNIQGWFPLGLTGLISLLSKRLSRVFSSTTVQRHQFFSFFMVQLLHLYLTPGKTHRFDETDLCQHSDVFAF